MNNSVSTLTRLVALLLLVVLSLSMVSCDKLPFDIDSIFGGDKQKDDPPATPVCEHDITRNGICLVCGEAVPITIAEALELCGEDGNVTEARYYIRATVKSITDARYGAMIIEDETGEISVYGTYSADGSIGYAEFEEKPLKGDEVLLHCILQNYNGNKEIKNARLIEFTSNQGKTDVSKYTKMSIAEARAADTGALVRVSGVVAQITYANGFKPSGVILVDSTSSIYVYDRDLAGQVKIGNTVEIAASKTYWVLETETNNAQKFGYKGANQLEGVIVISNDNGNTAFDKSWITETTVKSVMDTPVTEDITNKIFKANALIKKAPGQGFVNYYIDDLDGVTGSYVYTQCNGGDFEWMDKFDGKICTVYFVAINAKSTSSGCSWRLLPISVSDDGYVFNTDNTAKFVVDYYGVPAFESKYMINAKVELPISVSSELLGFENATLSYSSSDENVVSFTTDTPGVVTFTTKNSGTATVTIKGSYGAKTHETTISITVSEAVNYDSITVSQAVSATNNTVVTVKGIVGPSVVNQAGAFYLIDESGAIAVKGSAATIMDGLSIGDEIVVRGTRTITKDGGGQIVISEAKILANYYGENDYSTSSFITNKTIEEIAATADSPEATTQIYVVTANVAKVTKQQGSYTNITFYVGGVLLYSGSAGQYSWLESFFEDGKSEATLTVELALCDWNAKGLKGCVLAVHTDDGKVYNTLNFNK